MPVSQGSAGGIPGLNLKAWAYIKADGTLVRGFNVASVARTAQGNYTVNFTAAMSSTAYVCRMTPSAVGGDKVDCVLFSGTTAAASLVTKSSTLQADIGGLWEFYE